MRLRPLLVAILLGNLPPSIASAQDAVETTTASPFLQAEAELLRASDATKYYVMKATFKDKTNITEREFRSYSPEEKDRIASRSYHLANFGFIIGFEHSLELIDILNQTKSENDIKPILIQFEQAFLKIHGRYPVEFIAVDVAGIEKRLSDANRIR